ncbi:MAG: phosphoribosyltransferase [Ruminococcaceae bacterium]|nr:phosphoribosyltransferase [Oscillospiraceae bacterium]
MPTLATYKISTKGKNLHLRVVKGHFATSHSHMNYYVDVTVQKSRLSEADAVAKELSAYYKKNTIIDTILCLDETQVIGTCMASELTRGELLNMNAHQTIYVVTPEHTAGSQIIFRDGLVPMIQGKHVLILAASVNTGYTGKAAIEAVRYYGGTVVGIASIFATADSCLDIPVHSAFNPNDLQGYTITPSHECPMCKRGEKIDALVNSFGFSKL